MQDAPKEQREVQRCQAVLSLRVAYLFVLTARHKHILLVITSMKFGDKEHLALSKSTDDLPSLCIPQLDDLVIAGAEKFATVITELYISNSLKQ